MPDCDREAGTHHACACQIEWRRDAEEALRAFLKLRQMGYLSVSDAWLVARARRLLGEDADDAQEA